MYLKRSFKKDHAMPYRIFLMFAVLLATTGCYFYAGYDDYYYEDDYYHQAYYDIFGTVYAYDEASDTVYYPSGTDHCVVYLYEDGYLVDSTMPDEATGEYYFWGVSEGVYTIKAYYELTIDGNFYNGYSPVYTVYLGGDYALNIDLFGSG